MSLQQQGLHSFAPQVCPDVGTVLPFDLLAWCENLVLNNGDSEFNLTTQCICRSPILHRGPCVITSISNVRGCCVWTRAKRKLRNLNLKQEMLKCFICLNAETRILSAQCSRKVLALLLCMWWIVIFLVNYEQNQQWPAAITKNPTKAKMWIFLK